MALAPTGLARQTAYLEWTGSQYKIWMVFIWTENETLPSHYLVEAQRVSDSGWDQINTVEKGVRFCAVHVGNHAPPGWGYNQIYNHIRVTCFTDPDDGNPHNQTITFPFQTQRFRDNLVNVDVDVAPSGGSTIIEFSGYDDSYYIYCANLTVYNMTQNITQIYHRGLDDGDPALAVNYCNHHSPAIGFALTGNAIPNEGDRVQFHYVAIVGNGKTPDQLNAANDGIETVWTITYTVPVNFPFVSLAATQNNAFSYDAKFSPGITGNPFTATWSATGLPSGLSMSSSGVITGTPSALGTFTVNVTTTSALGDLGGGVIQIVVTVSQLPVITVPASVIFQQYAPSTLTLVATNNPTSFAVSAGTLPTGLSLNTTTGVISGTPTTIQAPASVSFTATNFTGTGPAATCSMSVVALPLPVISSPTTATGYRGVSFTYVITATNSPIAFSAVGVTKSLPQLGLALNAQTGLISGTLDPANLPGTYLITLRAQNATGYSQPVTLTLTLADRIPVIVSDLAQTTIAFTPYNYQIAATNYPVTYGATPLPFGLNIDPNSGLITGIPDIRGTFNITLSATNSAGTGSAVLVLTVQLDRPVIDTSITAGKAITCVTGVEITFQPVATNGPSFWVYGPTLNGFHFDTTTGKLDGTFAVVGLYGEIFYAGNVAGLSDPAVFYFLVEQSSTAVVAAALGSGLDIWIDIQDGSVSIMVPGQTMDQTVTTTQNGNTVVTQQTVAAPTTAAVLSSKRGDTLPLTIRFHKSGKPVIMEGLTSLIFGVREDFTLPYAVLTTGFLQNDDGSFAIFPNYSDNPEIDFEIDDTEEFLELMAEVQWEIGTNDPGSVPPFVRRSSQTFTNRVYRDVIHPDEPS